MKPIKSMTIQEEVALIKNYQKNNNDQKSFNTLLAAHLILINKVVCKYSRPGIDIDDLLSQALYGFMTGLKKFDVNRGFRLCTYVQHWIKAYIGKSSQYQYNYINRHKSLDMILGPKVTNDNAKSKSMVDDAIDVAISDAGSEYSEIKYVDESIPKQILSTAEYLADSLYKVNANMWSKNTNVDKGTVILHDRILADPEEMPTLGDVGKKVGLSKEGVRINELKIRKNIIRFMKSDLRRNAKPSNNRLLPIVDDILADYKFGAK